MKRSAFLVLLLLLVTPSLLAQSYDQLSTAAREFVSVSSPTVALVNVQLVDGTGAPPRSGQTIVLDGGKITAVGADVAIPSGAERFDLEGHTVLPALVGVHNHTFYTTAVRTSQMNVTAPRLYVASGVTTIRTTGSYSPYSEINMKTCYRGRRDRRVPACTLRVPTSPVLARALMMNAGRRPRKTRSASWSPTGRKKGATWFKAYTRISRAELGAAIEEAHSRGSQVHRPPVLGDLSRSGRSRHRQPRARLLHQHGVRLPTRSPTSVLPGFRESLRNLDIGSDEVQATIEHMVGQRRRSHVDARGLRDLGARPAASRGSERWSALWPRARGTST